MTGMSTAEAQAWLLRWQLVREAEAAELRRTTMATKLQQIASLMSSRDIFSADPERERQVQEVRERWRQLRQSVNA